jgi:hypothetical protein
VIGPQNAHSGPTPAGSVQSASTGTGRRFVWRRSSNGRLRRPLPLTSGRLTWSGSAQGSAADQKLACHSPTAVAVGKGAAKGEQLLAKSGAAGTVVVNNEWVGPVTDVRPDTAGLALPLGLHGTRFLSV